MTSLQAQKTLIQTTCPICGKRESIFVSESELIIAREQHSLITKAMSHSKEGHILTLYIDGQGIVRRKYCFDIAENRSNSVKSLPNSLGAIFNQMIQESKKP
ncbi:MAG: hypothetical protein ACFFAE_01705 [Candidatus Hodarchaeota archaeon]